MFYSTNLSQIILQISWWESILLLSILFELSNKPEIVTRNKQIATVSDFLSEIILLATPLLREQKFQCLGTDERAMTLPFRALTPSPWIP